MTSIWPSTGRFELETMLKSPLTYEPQGVVGLAGFGRRTHRFDLPTGARSPISLGCPVPSVPPPVAARCCSSSGPVVKLDLPAWPATEPSKVDYKYGQTLITPEHCFPPTAFLFLLSPLLRPSGSLSAHFFPPLSVLSNPRIFTFLYIITREIRIKLRLKQHQSVFHAHHDSSVDSYSLQDFLGNLLRHG